MKTILFTLGSSSPQSRSGEPWNISWTPCQKINTLQLRQEIPWTGNHFVFPLLNVSLSRKTAKLHSLHMSWIRIYVPLNATNKNWTEEYHAKERAQGTQNDICKPGNSFQQTWNTNLSFMPWTDKRPFIRYMSSLRSNNSVPNHMFA